MATLKQWSLMNRIINFIYFYDTWSRITAETRERKKVS